MKTNNKNHLPIYLKKTSLILCASVLIACAGNSSKEKAEVVYEQNVNETTKQSAESIERESLGALNEKIANAKVMRKTEAVLAMHSDTVALANAPVPQAAMAYEIADYRDDVYLPLNSENYASIEESAIKRVTENPVSTFSIDVDTGSYTNVRRMLNDGYLPPADAVRIEEFINYFDYNYQAPINQSEPFLVHSELSQTPWNAESKLLRLGIKAYEVNSNERPDANLVFLLDVSGSMNTPNKLPLLKQSFKLLSKNLNKNDRVSIVVYAGASGVVLEPTPGNNYQKIQSALNQLRAGGSTNGVAGINLAYQLAEEAFIEDGINRILIATDGDFNVGTSGVDELKRLIEDKRNQGISFTTLGFGSGNYNDHLMEQLANVGNGNHAYIDSKREAEKVLVTELTSTLLTVAKDVKIQVEFNPNTVSEYRLIGYENRALKREDFNNDQVDAGEIGAGHNVTALYEIFPVESASNIDSLRYSESSKRDKRKPANSNLNEYAFVKLRFKYPQADNSVLRSFPVNKHDEVKFSKTSHDFKFSTSVAAFAQKLKRSKYINDFSFEDILDLAENNLGDDPYAYRDEFTDLVSIADGLMQHQNTHLDSQVITISD